MLVDSADKQALNILVQSVSQYVSRSQQSVRQPYPNWWKDPSGPEGLFGLFLNDCHHYDQRIYNLVCLGRRSYQLVKQEAAKLERCCLTALSKTPDAGSLSWCVIYDVWPTRSPAWAWALAWPFRTLVQDWRDGSGVRALATLPEVWAQFPSSHNGGSEPSVTPVQGDLKPSSDLHRYWPPITYTDIHVGKTPRENKQVWGGGGREGGRERGRERGGGEREVNIWAREIVVVCNK